MRWDYWVRHYADDAAQARDSKATWTTPDGTLYTGSTPPEGSVLKGVLYPRAGTLGGCGSHNAMVMIYPHAADWEYLKGVTGDESWGPEGMRGYYERLEHATYLLANSVVGHGFSGWLKVGVTGKWDLEILILQTRIACRRTND